MCTLFDSNITPYEIGVLVAVLIAVFVVVAYMVRDVRRDAEDRKRRSYGMAPKRKEKN